MGADGRGGRYLMIPAGIANPITDARREDGSCYAVMDGKEVYKFAVKAMPHGAELALKRAGLKKKILTFSFHIRRTSVSSNRHRAASMFPWKGVRQHRKYANTSGASIPIALDEALRSGMIKRGDIVCLDGFGAGLTWASVVMKWY